MPVSEKQLGHAAAFHDKRKAEGWARLTFWADPEASEKLKRLVALHGGNRDAAMNALIKAAADEAAG